MFPFYEAFFNFVRRTRLFSEDVSQRWMTDIFPIDGKGKWKQRFKK